MKKTVSIISQTFYICVTTLHTPPFPAFAKFPEILGPWLSNTCPSPFLHPVDKAVLTFSELQLFLLLEADIGRNHLWWPVPMVPPPGSHTLCSPLPYRVGVTHILNKIVQEKWTVTFTCHRASYNAMRTLKRPCRERPTWPRTDDSCT